MKYSTTPTEELRDLLIDKLIKNPNDIVIEDSIDYITNTIKEITRLQQENKQLKELKKQLIEYIKPLVTEREDEKYYSITWYCKDVLLSWLGDGKNE